MPGMKSVGFTAGSSGADEGRPIGGNDSSTVLLLHFDGTSVVDSSSNSHTVLPAGNAATSLNSRKFGLKSLYLDGTGDYLEVSGDLTGFAFTDSDTWAIDFWANLEAVDQDQYILSKGDFNNSTGYALYFDQAAGNIIFYTNGAALITASWSPNANQYYHIAVVGDGTNIKLYIDGTSVGTATQVAVG